MFVEVLGVLVVAIVVVFIMLSLDYYRRRWPVANFPPGPNGLPVLGSVTLTKPDMHIDFRDMSQKYGRVFSIALGHFVAVVVNGKDAVKEALVTNMNATASRGENYVQQLYNPEHRGIIDGKLSESWQRQRHFAHTSLRGFGFGKASFESKVTLEVEELLGKFEINKGRPLDPSHLLSAATSSVMCSIALGVRFDSDDEKFLRLSHASTNWFNVMYRSNALNAFPFIRPFAGGMKRSVREVYGTMAKFVDAEIASHEASYTPEGQEPRDFIDCYLAEMGRQPTGLYTREDLRMILIDLFLGGTETTALLLTFTLLHMILNPEIQERVHQEIMEVVGPNRLPSMKDQSNLPYTKAVINETIRHGAIVPLTIRGSTKDFTLGGYKIPKGTTLIINIWSIHHDPEVWTNPDQFDPGRFFGEATHNRENLLPFGAGRRVCLGEQLAKMELFLFFAAMVHRFKFSLPPGYDKPSTVAITKFLNFPAPFELVVTPRL